MLGELASTFDRARCKTTISGPVYLDTSYGKSWKRRMPSKKRVTGGQMGAFLISYNFIEEYWEMVDKATALGRFQLR
jgi:hypothetical protein